MDRRTFLRASGVALGGLAALGPKLVRATSSSAIVPQRLGVQLYTVRDVFPDDFNGVLEMIKHIGYDEVEFAGYHDRDPQVVRAVLDDIGLTAPSAHIPLDALRDNLDATLEAAAVVGHHYIIVPWLPPEARTADNYPRLAETLNTIGRRVKDAGMQLAYHNHDFEFESVGARSGYDLLLDETDPDLVVMEMDLFWTVEAGQDPIAYFERYPGRFHLVHVKDRMADGTMVEVGAGAIDFRRIFDHAEQAGIRHAIVEHDNPEDPLESIHHSYDYLAQMRGS